VSENGAHRSSCCDIDFSHRQSWRHEHLQLLRAERTGTTSPPPSEPVATLRPCFPPIGACFPAVPGAKHTAQPRLQAGETLQAGASAECAARRHAHGPQISPRKTAANPLEVTASRPFVEYRVTSFPARSLPLMRFPSRQRGRLFAAS